MTRESTAWSELHQTLLSTEPACAGDDRFIRDGRSGIRSSELAAICADCPIFAECDTYARTLEPHRIAGFWASRWRGKPSPLDAQQSDS